MLRISKLPGRKHTTKNCIDYIQRRCLDPFINIPRDVCLPVGFVQELVNSSTKYRLPHRIREPQVFGDAGQLLPDYHHFNAEMPQSYTVEIKVSMQSYL